MELGHRPDSDDAHAATRRTWFRRESISLGDVVLLDAAYETAIATQAFAHMDFDRAQAIAEACGRQKMYIEAHGKLLDLLMRGQPMSVGFCRGIVQELGNFAGAVDAAYTRALGATGH